MSQVKPSESTSDDSSLANTSSPSSTSLDHLDKSSSIQDRSSVDIGSDLLAEQEYPANRLVHGHVLPSGWMCDYDNDTDQYKFEFQGEQAVEGAIRDEDARATNKTPTTDHVVQTSRRPTLDLFECKYGYHFPSSPTPSMISELAKLVQNNSSAPLASKTKQVGQGKSKLAMLSDEEEQARRLRDMFPTATGPVIDQMIKIYHGREGLIKAALISLGYKRVSEYDGQQATAQSPIMLMMSKPASKKLFDKLVSYFPDRDETLIKNLMFKHKEVEHEIISVLVESGQSSDALGAEALSTRSRKDIMKVDKNGAIMKLRYLKFLFPTCEEIELYHLLNCNDLNAQKVIEIIEKRGHKKANIDEVMQNRKSQTQQMRAQQAALAAKEKEPVINPIEAHQNRTKPVVSESRVSNMKDNLKKIYENYDDDLLFKALVSADYNEALAKKFLDEMKPFDDELYKQRYRIDREQEPNVVLFPCKGIQKDDTSFMCITSNENVAIAREVIECQTALALLKVDACTFTQDDFDKPRFTLAEGRKVELSVGSIFKKLEVKDSQRVGAKENFRTGSNYDKLCADIARSRPNQLALGRDKRLAKGSKSSARKGPNRKLIQRLHPFFKESEKLDDGFCLIGT